MIGTRKVYILDLPNFFWKKKFGPRLNMMIETERIFFIKKSSIKIPIKKISNKIDIKRSLNKFPKKRIN